MGRCGAGPFANDSADELLDRLRAVSPDERHVELDELLRKALADGEDAGPAEVVAGERGIRVHHGHGWRRDR
ncbi:hypothetical protein [Cellulomonas xiejunii]|uniref:Uncharacterized protein n=1 Tax=Cellulomonas xiejunii TaxID=2968083 RepID=A0ABY5KNP0_9CELL|nr:hypothetical protein [Cellulomonas xiejunii]MCC2315854.1 hypothetical protein [Cellulomonas xiejunii]MCC2320795.1 hypothetical protein [Cellulomonas xiejunii]UUI71081.1 hypothetical protein NP048_14965 [Cellulomonas xiejunii]